MAQQHGHPRPSELGRGKPATTHCCFTLRATMTPSTTTGRRPRLCSRKWPSALNEMTHCTRDTALPPPSTLTSTSTAISPTERPSTHCGGRQSRLSVGRGAGRQRQAAAGSGGRRQAAAGRQQQGGRPAPAGPSSRQRQRTSCDRMANTFPLRCACNIASVVLSMSRSESSGMTPRPAMTRGAA